MIVMDHIDSKLLFFAFKMHSTSWWAEPIFDFCLLHKHLELLNTSLPFSRKTPNTHYFYQVPGEHRGVYFPIEAIGFTWAETRVNDKFKISQLWFSASIWTNFLFLWGCANPIRKRGLEWQILFLRKVNFFWNKIMCEKILCKRKWLHIEI